MSNKTRLTLMGNLWMVISSLSHPIVIQMEAD